MKNAMMKKKLTEEFQKQKTGCEMRQEHIYETSQRAKKMWEISCLSVPDAGFLRLLVTQMRCVGKISLGLQILMVGFILLLAQYTMGESLQGGTYFQERMGVLFLCASAVAAAWSSVPAFARSFRWHMEELEEATYFSMSRVMIARMIVCIGSAVGMAAVVGGTVLIKNVVCLNEVVAYLILPFIVSLICIFYFMLRKKKENFVLGSTISLLFVVAGFLLWRKVWGYDGQGNVSGIIWSLCIVLMMVWIFEIQKLKEKNFYFAQEGGKIQWNFLSMS